MIVLECVHKCGDTGALHIKVEINVKGGHEIIAHAIGECAMNPFPVHVFCAKFRCVILHFPNILFLSGFFAGTSLASTLIGTRYETE